ncbi:MAG: RluA family pseudouridine synthase [Candidatus Magasanikbacteria bacterium]
MKSSAKFSVDLDDQGKRLDIFLSEKLEITRSQILKMIKRGQILVNDKNPKKAGELLKEGFSVVVKEEEKTEEEEIKEEEAEDLGFKIKIIKEETNYLVVEKPAGMLVHPTEAFEPNTLTDFLKEKYPEIKKVGDAPNIRPGIVHRLDKEASGLLVIARTQKMFEHLKKQFQKREVEKEYGVLVYGQIQKEHNLIDFDIDRGVDGKMASRPKIDSLKLKNVGKEQVGRESLTEFWVEEELSRFSFLKVKIHTGRTHQIRVHMFAFGHPVVGDTLYFNKKLIKKTEKKLGRLFLHARKLCFEDLKGEKVCFESELPSELKNYLNGLK